LLTRYDVTVESDQDAVVYFEGNPKIWMGSQNFLAGKLTHVGEVSAETPLVLTFQPGGFYESPPETHRFYVLAPDGEGAFTQCGPGETAIVGPDDWLTPPMHMPETLAGHVVPQMDEALVIMALGGPHNVTSSTTAFGTVKSYVYPRMVVTITNGAVSSVIRL
jgi:hypothetical protein